MSPRILGGWEVWEDLGGLGDTVSENQCYTPRLTVFCLVHLKNLPVEKMPQMRYHLKALTQSFQNL